MSEQVNDKSEVIEKLLKLTDTVEDGIRHIDLQLKELRFEEAILLLQDVVKAIATMQKAVSPILETLPANEVNPLTKNLMEQIGVFIDMYQNGNKEEMAIHLSNTIIPVYTRWQEELHRVLKPLLTN